MNFEKFYEMLINLYSEQEKLKIKYTITKKISE